MSSTGPLLDVRNIALAYAGIEAVRDVSLYVNAGEIVTLVGANGVGKSSTLKAICRLVPILRGEVLLSGASLAKVRTEAIVGRGVALVPERRRLFAAMTVLDNLEMGAYGQPRAQTKTVIEEMLELFPSLARYAKKRAAGLSGGEQQMLAIARGLMSRPKLLLLDEPSLGLAPLLVEQVFDRLLEVNKAGTTILLIEQNVSLALEIADRGYVMSSGRTILEGTSAELTANEEVQRAYLGGAEAEVEGQ